MSPARAAQEISESTAVKFLAGFLLSVAAPIGLWIFYQAETDLKSHGETLARISVVLDDVRHNQTEMKADVELQIGGVVRVADEQAKQLAALKQALEDGARARGR